MQELDWSRAGIKTTQLYDSSHPPNILFCFYLFIYFIFFQFLMGSVTDINKLYQYITTFNLINITIKNIAQINEKINAVFVRSPYWMYKATQISVCVASTRWRAGERSRSEGVRSIARRALTLLNAPLQVIAKRDLHSHATAKMSD